MTCFRVNLFSEGLDGVNWQLTNSTLLLRQYELTNKNVSYFLTNQSKTKTFIDLKVTRKPKPTKNSTRPYLNEIPAHFIHEIKTIAYDVT